MEILLLATVYYNSLESVSSMALLHRRLPSWQSAAIKKNKLSCAFSGDNLQVSQVRFVLLIRLHVFNNPLLGTNQLLTFTPCNQSGYL